MKGEVGQAGRAHWSRTSWSATSGLSSRHRHQTAVGPPPAHWHGATSLLECSQVDTQCSITRYKNHTTPSSTPWYGHVSAAIASACTFSVPCLTSTQKTWRVDSWWWWHQDIVDKGRTHQLVQRVSHSLFVPKRDVSGCAAPEGALAQVQQDCCLVLQ